MQASMRNGLVSTEMRNVRKRKLGAVDVLWKGANVATKQTWIAAIFISGTAN